MNRRTLLLQGATTLGLLQGAPSLLQNTSEKEALVGAWRVDVQGAPFASHLMLFHADGTMLTCNPDAGDPGSSDSDGLGVWTWIDHQTAKGAFEELDVSRLSHQLVARLRVEFTITVERNTFHGPAQATVYPVSSPTQAPGDPIHVMFQATRIHLP